MNVQIIVLMSCEKNNTKQINGGCGDGLGCHGRLLASGKDA